MCKPQNLSKVFLNYYLNLFSCYFIPFHLLLLSIFISYPPFIFFLPHSCPLLSSSFSFIFLFHFLFVTSSPPFPYRYHTHDSHLHHCRSPHHWPLIWPCATLVLVYLSHSFFLSLNLPSLNSPISISNPNLLIFSISFLIIPYASTMNWRIKVSSSKWDEASCWHLVRLSQDHRHHLHRIHYLVFPLGSLKLGKFSYSNLYSNCL